MEPVNLNRYQLTGLLGSGADYEVRAAMDRETGQEVVLKRPVPQMISRRMHSAVDSRTDHTLQVHAELGQAIPGLAPILGYTERANHDAYFGEDLGQDYRVIIAARAEGIPLVGDPRSRILRVPIGLGQNLFGLFPLAYLDTADPFPVQRQLLAAQERFYRAGYVLLDLGPQNLFLQPANAAITIIDSGALLTPDNDRTPVGRGPQDIHDFYLEMLKFYTAVEEPPAAADGYREPYGLRPVVNFEQELAEMARRLERADSAAATAAVKAAGLPLLTRVRERDYPDFADFRRDFTAYLDTLAERNRQLPDLSARRRAWQEALNLLRADHWRRYRFDPEAQLAGFETRS